MLSLAVGWMCTAILAGDVGGHGPQFASQFGSLLSMATNF